MGLIKLGDSIIEEIIIDANPDLGFNFPFKIYIPQDMPDTSEVVFKCNVTRNYIGQYDTLEEIQEAVLKEGFVGYSNLDIVDAHFVFDLKCPLIVPAIPRGSEFRPHFLGRSIYKLNESGTSIPISKEDKILDIKKYYKLDEQEKNMINFALDYLRGLEKDISDKVILSGYSEGSKWASHFALLHPEVVKGIVAGGTGGLMSMPLVNEDGYMLTYPTGIADVQFFDEEEYNKIAFFYYMGSTDKADPARPKFQKAYEYDENGNLVPKKDECGNSCPLLDDNGKPVFILKDNGDYQTSYPSMYSDQEVNNINKALGLSIQDRFRKQEEIFNDLGLNATCKMYEGNHRTIFKNSEELFNDIDYFMTNNLNKRETLGTK